MSQNCDHTEHDIYVNRTPYTTDTVRIGRVPGGSGRFSHWEPCDPLTSADVAPVPSEDGNQ